MTAICPVCQKDIESESHGACWRATYDRLMQVIAGQRDEIAGLRSQLQDAGILTKRRP